MQSDSNATRELPLGRFTDAARQVLELSLREALSLGHNYIGPEHLLLALVRQGEGAAWQTLRNFSGDTERIREEVLHQVRNAATPHNPALARARATRLENLRIEVARWANERRGIRQSDLLAIYEARIFTALDQLGPWREKEGTASPLV